MPEAVITINNLNKQYKDGPKALSDINLEFKKGEIFGLLGPNGAGKTTLINIIAGLSTKTSGQVNVLGKDIIKDYKITKRKIGVVQQEINADHFFSVEETVKLQGGLFGLRNMDDRIEGILKTLSLWDKRKTQNRRLSGGMKRRVMIAKAMMHDPEILFLDEPTAGVDVELRENLWKLIRDLKSQGKTIILTTHYLEEAENLADRIGIINNGKIILVENKNDLLTKHDKSLQDIYLAVINTHNS